MIPRANRRGLSRSPEYTAWYSANARCSSQRSRSWPAYGGRGICVCAQWSWPNGFERFLADMGQRPDGMSLDRINVNGNYEPGNCRWADDETQQSNKRPFSAENRAARDRAIGAVAIPRLLERIEDRLLRSIADELIETFGPLRGLLLKPHDMQLDPCMDSEDPFRRMDVTEWESA